MTSSNVSNGWRWIGLIILLLVLLVLWLMGYGPSFSGSTPGCCGIPISTPAAVLPPAPEQKSAVNLSLQANNGKVTLKGELPSETEKQLAVQAATEIFGAGNFIDQLTVSAHAGLPGWWPKLSPILSWLKNDVGFGLSQNGATLTLFGQVESDSVKQAKAAEIKSLVGPGIDTVNRMTVAANISAPADSQACSDKMTVTVLFANNSSELTSDGKETLAQVTGCLTGPTEVGGHTDSVGTDAFNIRLSQARAASVIAYMASIDPDKQSLLIPVGHGESKPVASNATEAGRAKNRRIEFTAK